MVNQFLRKLQKRETFVFSVLNDSLLDISRCLALVNDFLIFENNVWIILCSKTCLYHAKTLSSQGGQKNFENHFCIARTVAHKS